MLEYVWIYSWNTDEQEFYAIPIPQSQIQDNGLNRTNIVVQDPIRVIFDTSAYDHLVIVTCNHDRFDSSMIFLQNCGLLDYYTLESKDLETDRSGHLIMSEVSLEDLQTEKYRGYAARIFCSGRYRCMSLYNLLKYNYYPFGINALGKYTNSYQCYFDVERRRNPHFHSRGLFRVQNEKLEFVSGDLDNFFPPYRILAFDIEASRHDLTGVIPRGDSSHDRLVVTSFQTSTVINPQHPTELSDIETLLVVYYPNRQQENREFSIHTKEDTLISVELYSSEKQTLARSLELLSRPRHIFATGYNTDGFDHPFLFKRALFHGLLPGHLVNHTYILRSYCNLSVIPHMTPPWILDVDVMICRKKFFPIGKFLEPPSDSLDACAEAILGRHKTDFNIVDINQMYKKLEETGMEPDQNFFEKFLDYCRVDVDLVTQLNGHLNTIRITVGLSRMGDADPYHCLGTSSTAIVRRYLVNLLNSIYTAPIDENLLTNTTRYSPFHWEIGRLLPSHQYARHSNEQRNHLDVGRKNTYKGAEVFEPEIGVHVASDTHAIYILDFNSLYPSLIMEYNLNRGFVTRISRHQLSEIDENIFHILLMDEDPYFAYLSVKVQEGRPYTQSPLRKICEKLVKERGIMKKAGMNTQANALKIMVNSIYGAMAVIKPLADELVPCMVTGYGRYHLNRARCFYINEKGNGIGAKVLYGDTDSLFLWVPRSAGTGDELAARYNANLRHDLPFTSYLQIAFESAFGVLVLIQKKHYMAIQERQMGNKCKVSGYKKRINLCNNRDLLDLLQRLLILLRDDNPTHVLGNIRQVVITWFNQIITINPNDINNPDRDRRFMNTIKIRPLHTYKSNSCMQYCLGTKIEQLYPGTLTAEGGTHISYYILIPLVPRALTLPKCVCLCPTNSYKPEIQIINRSMGLISDVGQTFNAFIQSVDLEKGSQYSIENLSTNYQQGERYRLYEKHVKQGYRVCNLSACKLLMHIPRIDLTIIWPSFYQMCLQNPAFYMGSVNRTYQWWYFEHNNINNNKKQAFTFILRITLYYNKNNKKIFATVDSDSQCRKFKNLKDISSFLSGNISKLTHLILTNPTNNNNNNNNNNEEILVTLNSNSFEELVAFFIFIYSIEHDIQDMIMEMDETNNKTDQWLIILPFIALRRDSSKENSYYTFF
ncbi:DNA polymerase catalytic subunit [Astathelohania contejeani]|uniref:DNA polymerase n=1 Tax=Astathelohania contejeani TaxID=164912 RepID=A0ABQ7HY11_9MICR|nr:DNA polymerase catalytic subunit [Thelohania contejeani]